MKKIAIFILIIIIAGAGALWFLAPGALNDFIKTQIETIGSQTTDQIVSVNNVDVRLTQGMASINGLTISSPSTYQQKHAFTLGTILLDIDINSLTAEPIIIENFTIKDAKAFVEVTKTGDSNFKDILDAINKNTPDPQAQAIEEQETGKTPEPKIRIEKLILSGVGLTVDLRQLGNKEHQETLPEINLGSIGGQAGIPASQIGIEIGKRIMSSMWKQAKKVQMEKLKDKAKEKVQKKVTKELNRFLDKLGS